MSSSLARSARAALLAAALVPGALPGPARAAAPADPPAAAAPMNGDTLTAERAVALALERNPALQAAAVQAASASWEVVGEEGRYPLRLLGDAEASRSQTPALAAPDGVAVGEQERVGGGLSLQKHLLWGTDLTLRVDGGGVQSRAGGSSAAGEVGPAWDLGARFSVVQPLLRGAGRAVNEAPLLQARARKSRADLARDRLASQTVDSVLTAYWELWYAERSVEIARDALAVAERSRDDAAARVRTGSLAPVEALSFETRVATRREELAEAEATRAARAATLAAALGLAGTSVGSPSEPLPPEPTPPAGDLAEAALGASPELEEARAAVEVARAAAVDAGDATRPRVDLEAWAEARRLGDDVSPFAPRPDADGGYSAGVGLSVELPFDRRQERAARARAELAVEAAERDLERVRQEVLSSVATLAARAEAARRRVELAGATLAAAERQLQGQRTRFATGNATALEVLEAEDEVRSARLRQARSRIDLLLAVNGLEDRTGTLVSRYAVALNSTRDGGSDDG
jgi:outer membrane protein TolC